MYTQVYATNALVIKLLENWLNAFYYIPYRKYKVVTKLPQPCDNNL